MTRADTRHPGLGPGDVAVLAAVLDGPGDDAAVAAAVAALCETIGRVLAERAVRDQWTRRLLAHAGRDSFPGDLVAADRLARKRDAGILRQLYRLLDSRGRTDEALRMLDAVLRCLTTLDDDLIPPADLAPEAEVPDNVRALAALRRLQAGDRAGATRLIEGIAGPGPLAASATMPLCLALAGQGEREAAKRLLGLTDAAADLGGGLGPRRFLELCHACIQLEDIPRLRRLLARAPDRDFGGEQLGLLFSFRVRFDDPARALALLPRLEAADQIWSQAYLYKAFALRRLFRFEEALAALDQDADRNGTRDQNVHYRAQFLWESGRLDEALAVLEAALAKDDRLEEATRGILRHQAAMVRRSLGQWAPALVEHERAARLYPRSWIVRHEHALTLWALDRPDEALVQARLGARETLFAGNLCPFLAEALAPDRPRRLLCPETALRCLAGLADSSAPWLAVRAPMALLALRSLEAAGRERELRLAGADLRAMAGLAEPEALMRLGRAIEAGQPLAALARDYAAAAFPGLPETAHDRRFLLRLAAL